MKTQKQLRAVWDSFLDDMEDGRDISEGRRDRLMDLAGAWQT